MRIYFNSQQGLDAAKNAGVPLGEAQVIHSGVDTRLFTYRTRSGTSVPLKLVLPGRVAPVKGIQDGIAALHELTRLFPGIEAHLNILVSDHRHQLF